MRHGGISSRGLGRHRLDRFCRVSRAASDVSILALSKRLGGKSEEEDRNLEGDHCEFGSLATSALFEFAVNEA